MSKGLLVTKRNGDTEPFTFNKIHQVLFWATDNITGVSVSEIELKAEMQFYDKINTNEIHESLIKSAADLISEDNPNYQFVAARLTNFTLRKQVYKQYDPIPVLDHVKKCVDVGVYDSAILDTYTDDDWVRLNKIVKHERDDLLSYAAFEQFRGKYLVQNRTTNTFYETPQMVYILIAAVLFGKYASDIRLRYVRDYYDAISMGPKSTITLPTPVLAGVRTPTRQFSSCFPAGQQVRTQDTGLMNIENIIVGDVVLTHSGEWQPVVATRKKVYSGNSYVSFRSQYTIPFEFESTEDHFIRTIVKSDKRQMDNVQWVRADALCKGDMVHIPFNRHVVKNPIAQMIEYWPTATITDNMIHRPYTADIDKRRIPTNITIDGDLLRLFGYYLAEGHACKKGRYIQFTFNRLEKTWISDVTELIKRKFNDISVSHVNNPNDLSMNITVYNPGIVGLFVSMCGTGFHDKYLSDLIMRCDPADQKQLLIGVIRGDGCIHHNGMSLSLSNKELMTQLGELCLRCGLYPSLNTKTSAKMNSVPSRRRSGIYTKHDAFIITMGIGGNLDFLLSVEKNVDKLDTTRTTPPRWSKYTKGGEYFSSIFELRNRRLEANQIDHVYDLQVDNVPSFVVAAVGVHNCVLIETEDSLDSLNECASSVVDYVSKRAGIGLNLGRIRAKGASVRNGEVYHTGNIPFYKYMQAALKSCSQGSIRSGSATTYFPFWHAEVEDLLVLKNNKGTEETRVRNMDYGVQLNGFLMQRLIDGKDITLFDPSTVPDLYEAFFADQDLFATLYDKYERARSIKKSKVSAVELFNTLIIERNNTGRIYIQFVDHSNDHGAFKPQSSPIRMSNLCCEICLPTAGLTKLSRLPCTEGLVSTLSNMPPEEFQEQYGEIALCTLSSFNWGAIHSPEDFEKPADLAIRALDELLDYQDYPMLAAGYPATQRRSLGVGICNLAYFIAKHGDKYSDGSANDLVNEYCEAMSYWLMVASNNLAKEKGACGWYNETKASQGILPIDTYKKDVDELLTTPHYLDWTKLRASIAKHGMRNSTVMALMPVESSSQIINATNGIEPPRSSVSIKASKHGTLKQVVPEIHRFKNKYEYLWDVKSPRGYLEIAAILQKWTDQAISSNTSYNPSLLLNEKLSTTILLGDIFYAYKLGIKTLYYQNTNDGSGEIVYNSDTEEDCEACKL